MVDNVSNRTVFILVVLTIIVSTLGTLTVLESVNRAQLAPVPVGETSVQSGEITLKILEAPKAVGQVTLEITDQNGGE